MLLAVAFLTLHAVAAFVVPSRLWGGSHLAAWPATAGLTFLGVMLAATLLGGSLAPKLPLPPFPGERRTWLVAAVSAITFALLCERHHLYGDGSVLLRSRGMSFTVFRGPVIVKSVAFFVQTVEERLGLSVETAFRLLAVASGVVVVYLCVRLCRNLGRSDAERLILLAALAGSGAWQIFFGHIEYYPLLTVAVMFYLFFAVRALQRQATIWWTWPLFAALLPFHFSALCLAPAQLYVGLSAWRTEGPR
ncbi:MAG: hypothetical protein KC729_06275, partial [Candidatus Eisenbacteria bacterium]|nr:hypothetical protein [Candidatus Eisenbacteria bacterium]